MTEDPFIAMRLLVKRLTELADDIGLDVASADFMPEGNLVDVLFSIRPEILMDEEEVGQAKSDFEFDLIVKGFDSTADEPLTVADKAVADRAEKAREQLKKWIEEKDGNNRPAPKGEV